MVYVQPAIWIAVWKCLWIDKSIRLKGNFSLKLWLDQQPYHILKGAALFINCKRGCDGACNPRTGQERIRELPRALLCLLPLYLQKHTSLPQWSPVSPTNQTVNPHHSKPSPFPPFGQCLSVVSWCLSRSQGQVDGNSFNTLKTNLAAHFLASCFFFSTLCAPEALQHL